MAKAQVLKHLGEGKYQIRLKYAVERVQAEKARIENRLAELAVEVPTSKTDVIAKEAEVAAAEADIDALIPAYRAGTDGARKQITEKQVALINLRGELTKLVYQRDLLIAENLSLLKRRNQIDRIPEDKALEAWCADFTTDLSGAVGVADINDEGGQGVVLQPGYDGSAGWNAARDGVLMPREAQSGAQLFFNAAILPGVQKWQPRYRVATISNIESDTCTITLDPANSSAQALNINATQVYTGVPIEYMDCNAAAFEDGDSVLVRFTQSGPLVVGFRDHPRECKVGDFAMIPSQLLEDAGGERREFGLPEIGGDPLGTVNGDNPTWHYKETTGGNYEFSKYKAENYGPKAWYGPSALVISWRSSPTRVISAVDSVFNGTFMAMFLQSEKVYCNGQEVADIGDVTNGASVYGAAVSGGTLRVVILRFSEWQVIEYPWQGRNVTGPGVVVDTIALSEDWRGISGWYFNEAGTEAILTLRTATGYTGIATQRYTVGSGFGAIETIWEQGPEGYLTVTGSGNSKTYDYQIGQHDIPIYVDFVGNDEVTLYVRHHPYSETGSHDGLGPNAQQNYTRSKSGVDFVLSTGEVLASIGPAENETYLLETNYNDSGPNEMVKQVSINERVFTGTNFFADLRHKVVMVEVLETTTEEDFSGQPNGSNMVAGTGTYTTQFAYEMYVNGVQKFRKVGQYNSTTATETQYEQVANSPGGVSGPLDGEEHPTLGWTQAIHNVGYLKFKGQEVLTLAAYWSEGLSVSGVPEGLYENQLTGFADPELQLFDGRSEMTFYALGRL